ncbi:MAG: hypothetical protein ABFQ64_10195 [Campylobacterota bacterium]
MKKGKFFAVVLLLFSLLFSACSGGSDADFIIHNGTGYKSVTSPYTGKVWLDRNLGAIRVCEAPDDMACYGDYYQWGRNYDGHEDKSSDINSTLALDIADAGEDFIITSAAPDDWAEPLVDDDGSLRSFNWSKIDGDSVCPVGYRVPTVIELRDETLDNNASDPFGSNVDAFNNFLKLPSAGERDNSDGDLINVRDDTYLWLNGVDGNQSYFLNASENADIYTDRRSRGFAIRCIED